MQNDANAKNQYYHYIYEYFNAKVTKVSYLDIQDLSSLKHFEKNKEYCLDYFAGFLSEMAAKAVKIYWNYCKRGLIYAHR